jgi:hypothetical protein
VFGGSFAGVCQFTGCGNVFELSPNLTGGWTETVLYEFSGGADGGNPEGTLVLDGQGNIYGTAVDGGTPGNSSCAIFVSGCGVVFKLTASGGGNWPESVLYAFNGNPDGGYPQSGVVIDASGNIFGTNNFYAKNGVGTVYELTPNGLNGYSHRTLYTFTNGKDGGRPDGVALDASGNVFVSTTQAGSITGQCKILNGCGTLLEFSPNVSGNFSGRILYSFQGKHDGAIPVGISVDANGNVFGSAVFGGLDSVCNNGGYLGCGVIFKFSPQGGKYQGSIAYSFGNAADGLGPRAAPAYDSAGNVYVTSNGNGSGNVSCCGGVIKLTPSGSGFTETTLYLFLGSPDGSEPTDDGVAVDSATGTVYGTTQQGGEAACTLNGPPGCGVIYKVTQ